MINIKTLSIFILTCITPSLSIAATQVVHEPLDLTNNFIGFASIAIFILAYLMVMIEEFTELTNTSQFDLIP